MIRGINFSYVCHGLAFFLLVSTEDFSSAKPSPLLESDGTSIKVLGFSPKQRAVFIHVLMRFGLGDFTWVEFIPRLKPKTVDEIQAYVPFLFLDSLEVCMSHGQFILVLCIVIFFLIVLLILSCE
jgi:hypothetical protein